MWAFVSKCSAVLTFSRLVGLFAALRTCGSIDCNPSSVEIFKGDCLSRLTTF